MLRLLTTERLFLIIFFISVSAAIQGYVPDIYLHLTTGKHILATGELSHTDPFSFTRYGEPWVMHEWLFQVFIYLLNEKFGVIALQVISGAILTTTLYINKVNCRLVGASDVTAWISTIILFVTWLFFVGSRPHIFTYLFFTLSLFFILLHRHKGRTKPLYLIPLMMVPWVNIHGGFIIGLVLVGYITLLSFIEDYVTTRRWKIPRHLTIALILSLGTSLLSPYGMEQLFFPFQLMDQWVMTFVPEWMPPDFSEWNYMLYAVISVIFVITSLWSRDKRAWFGLALALPFIAASFNSVRHIPLAAFIISPYLAVTLHAMAQRHVASKERLKLYKSDTSVSGMATMARSDLGIIENILNGIVLLCFCTAFYLAYPMIHAQKTQAFVKLFPVGATEYLIANNLQGRMFTSMQYSDYILFHRYPEQKLFYDVRLETYGKELSSDYIKMVYAHEGWEALFKKHRIDYVVIDKTGVAHSAFARNPYFKVLYEDEYSIIYSREEHD
ncbi:MAG: hypothetical protein OQL08_02600 [Gammaproteobacteria bacterium]|nr:hypothetical protein [Gammaproteobacteria bacterium]